MRKSTLIVAVAALAALVPVTSAVASPSTFQRFSAKVSGKAGTNSKPKSVGAYLRPYYVVGKAGGPANTGNQNSGALLEAPFATAFANVYLPKQLTFSTAGFPACSESMILSAPDSCPKGSEIGSGAAAGFARNAPVSPLGQYVLDLPFTVRVFISSAGKNAVALRLFNTVTSGVIIDGVVSKASGSAAKSYGSRLRFTIPHGLIEPLPGIIAQLSDFSATLKPATYKRHSLITLKACPKNKKLNFGFNGEYNIGLDKTKLPKTASGYSIDSVGKVINTPVACKK